MHKTRIGFRLWLWQDIFTFWELGKVITTSLLGAEIMGCEIAQNLRILRFSFLIFVCLLASCISKVEAEEKLLYALRYESLQRYPDIFITKICSLDLNRRVSHPIFSGENSTIMLLPILMPLPRYQRF